MRWQPIALVFSFALTALLATIVFVACSGDSPSPTTPVNTDGTIAAGVTINGVELGGLNQDEALAKLQSDLPDIASGKLTITIGALTQDVTYASVSRTYDLVAIINDAFASGGGAVEPKVTYDADALATQVNDFVTTAQAAPVNATISFENGEYVLTAASDGRTVDGAAVLTNAGGLMGNGTPDDQVLDVPVTLVPADINSDAAQAAIDRAQAVTAQPLTITAGGHTFIVDTALLRTWVTIEQTAPGQWDLTVDDSAVGAYINTIKTQVDQPAVDAEWHFGDSAEPVVIPSQTGYEVDSVAAVAQVEAAIGAAQPGVPLGTIALNVVATEPDFTTAEAQAAAGNVSLLGSWTTHYIPSHFNGDGINIRRPAALIDGTVIGPGDLFDFVKIAGPITVANGYTDGAAIIHGQTKGEGVLGGGLCSASTTMFNAALRAGFQMGARYNHYYYITRYPIGLDATIWINGSSVKNMTFTNDSKYPIVIRSINKKRAVTFQVWGVGDGRTVNLADPVVSNEKPSSQWYEFTDTLGPRETNRTEYGADGFDAIVVRTVRDAHGNVIHSDSFRSDYGRVDGIVLVGRYPGDPPAHTRIPYENGLPPHPGPTPTPTPGPTPVDSQPVAKFKINVSGSPTIGFNASKSTGDGLSYSWNFGDGSPTGSGVSTSHTYDASFNMYTVTLTVTDADGDVAMTSKNVTVGSPPPEPTPCEPPADCPPPS